MKFGGKLKRCIYPAVCAFVSFILFIPLYIISADGLFAVNKDGLMYILPTMAFVVIAVFAAYGKISSMVSAVVTTLLLPVIYLMFCMVIFILSLMGGIK